MSVVRVLSLVIGLLLVGLPAGTARPSQADVCVIVDGQVVVGCSGDSPPPPQPSSAASTSAPDAAPSSSAAVITGTTAAAPAVAAAGAVRTVPATPRYARDLLLVKFADGVGKAGRERVLDAAGVTVRRRIDAIGLYVVKVAPARRAQALAALDASPAVASAGKDPLVDALETVPNDTDWSGQWGLQRIHLPAAWDRTHGSSSVVVAVLDTGVDAAHRDLSGATLPGFDLVNGDNNAADDEGHGTGVAGVIAARTNNREGVAGVCWACSILPVKVLDSSGSGDLATVAAGIVRAVDAGAHVVNLSLGGPADDPSLDDAVSYATRNGVLVVAAAGNNGTASPFYPAATPGVISVAATDDGDSLYSWSNHGSWAAVAAPGCNPTSLRGGGYGIYCGTSFAAPVVAGLLGLERSLQPSATRDQLLTALEQSTQAIGVGVSRGRIDAAAALAAVPGPPAPVPAPAQPATKSLSGSLPKNGRTWSARQAIGAGPATVTVTSPGSAQLTAALVDRSGALVRRTGPSPLQLSGEFQAGKLTIGVAGSPAKLPFSAVLVYPRGAGAAEAPTAPAVLLSSVPETPVGVRGPQLGAPPAPSGAIGALGFDLADRPRLATSILSAVNQLRRARGLPPVAGSVQLARAAQAHVRALAASGRFSHDWSDGTPFATWILRYFPAPASGTWVAGENLIWSATPLSAQASVAAWLASPEHRQILLDPRWRQLGLGAVQSQAAPGVYGGSGATVVAADFGAIGANA